MAEKILVRNRLIETKNVKKVINPFTNDCVGEYYAADETHFNESAEYLKNAFVKFSALPVYKRKELLSRISETISRRKIELAKLITSETGKPIKFSLIEIDRAILTFSLGAEECSRINGEVLNLDLLKGSEAKMGIVRQFPLGIILAITPWNFPVNLVAHKVSPALASGNVVMLKPSSNSMLCGLEIGKIILEISNELDFGFCPINVLTLSGSEIDMHLGDERIKMVSFTGSPDIGWAIKGKAIKQRVSLELGGNAGVIVTEDTDLEVAVPKITLGGLYQAGQSCISVQRVYVHDSIYDKFRDMMVKEAEKTKFGNPFEVDTLVGPMITEAEAIRAEKWIAEAKESGANILTGGKREGAVLQPTIIENAPNKANVKCKEVFAPVITIESYKSFEEAVNEINDSRFGLQAGVFTNDMRKILYAYNNIHAGGVIINEASSYRMDSMPYGGTKDSGNAREGVSYAIKEMTEEKILVV